MAGFGLGFLANPTDPQDLLDPDFPQLEENFQQVIPPSPRPQPGWAERVIQPPGTADSGVSSWHPQGIPEDGLEGNPATGEPPSTAYPGLKGKVIPSPNEERGEQYDPDNPTVPQRGPQAEPIALQRFMTNSGVPFIMDERAGPQMKAFLDEMEKEYPIDPKQSGGYARRYIRGTKKASAHSDLDGEVPRAFDYNWTTNPMGGNSQFDDARVRSILARHPGIQWGADFGDKMHFEVRRSHLGRAAAQSARGTGKMDEEQGIGGLVDPRVQEGARSPQVAQADALSRPDPAAAPYSSWSDMVNAGRRNALITFGLHAMTGGYGLGSAIGAGMESMGATNAAMAGQLQNEQKTEDSATEKERDRVGRERVAQIGADSRQSVAEARIAAMLERTRMNLEAKVQNPSLALKYRTEARKIVEGNINNLQLSQGEREMMVDQLAGQMYDTDVARGRVGSGIGGQNSAGGPDYSGMGGGEAPAGKPAATAAEKGKSSRSLMSLAKDPEHGRQFIKDLESPEGQQKILSAIPSLKAEIDNYNASSFHPLKMLKTYGF